MVAEKVHIKDHTFKTFIECGEISAAVKRMAEEINKDFYNEAPVFLVILNGAFMFASDLIKHIEISCEVSFVKLQSYEGMESSKLKKLIGLEKKLEGRKVIVVEDIVDSGNTLTQLIPQIESMDPSGIAIATLLFKPDSLKHDIDLDYVGFEIPDEFVVGYGLDYDGYGRNLPDIYQLGDK